MRFANVAGRGAVVVDGTGHRHRRASAAGSAAIRRVYADLANHVVLAEIAGCGRRRRSGRSSTRPALGPPGPAPVASRWPSASTTAPTPSRPGASCRPSRTSSRRRRTASSGPFDDIVVPAGLDQVDYEAELVVVFGRTCKAVAAADAWSHLAGVTCGQDVSDRFEQRRPPLRQFTVAKSYDTFGPTGRCLVTPDELADPDALPDPCTSSGEVMQDSNTDDLIFGVGAWSRGSAGYITFGPAICSGPARPAASARPDRRSASSATATSSRRRSTASARCATASSAAELGDCPRHDRAAGRRRTGMRDALSSLRAHPISRCGRGGSAQPRPGDLLSLSPSERAPPTPLDPRPPTSRCRSRPGWSTPATVRLARRRGPRSTSASPTALLSRRPSHHGGRAQPHRRRPCGVGFWTAFPHGATRPLAASLYVDERAAMFGGPAGDAEPRHRARRCRRDGRHLQPVRRARRRRHARRVRRQRRHRGRAPADRCRRRSASSTRATFASGAAGHGADRVPCRTPTGPPPRCSRVTTIASQPGLLDAVPDGARQPPTAANLNSLFPTAHRRQPGDRAARRRGQLQRLLAERRPPDRRPRRARHRAAARRRPPTGCSCRSTTPTRFLDTRDAAHEPARRHADGAAGLELRGAGHDQPGGGPRRRRRGGGQRHRHRPARSRATSRSRPPARTTRRRRSATTATVSVVRAAQTLPSHAIVGVSPRGFDVFTLYGAHVVADVAGYYLGTPAAAPFGAPANANPTTAGCVGLAADPVGAIITGSSRAVVAKAQQRLLELGFWVCGVDGHVRPDHLAGGDGVPEVDRACRATTVGRRGHRGGVEHHRCAGRCPGAEAPAT